MRLTHSAVWVLFLFRFVLLTDTDRKQTFGAVHTPIFYHLQPLDHLFKAMVVQVPFRCHRLQP